MSLRSHRILHRCVVAALITGAALTAPSMASAADGTTGCPDQPTTQAFAKFGDTADYSLVPGGDFEQGSSGWTYSNARPVAGNETAGVLPGKRSVAMGNNWFFTGPSTLTSPWFCVSDAHPYFRFLLKPNGPVGVLATFIRFTDASGRTVQQQVQSKIATNLFPGKWAPSELNPLSINLSIGAGESKRVQLVFMTLASVLGAGYYIDNVLVDPYRRG